MIELHHESKRTIALNLHRFPYGYGKGYATCLFQCNRSIGAKYTVRKYRKEMLKEIKDHLNKINAGKEEMIVGDFNQEIGGDGTQQFYSEIGVQYVLSGHGRIPWNDRDITFKRGSRCADYISVIEGLILVVEGFEVTDWDEKISTDHRGNVIELNLEQFSMKTCMALMW